MWNHVFKKHGCIVVILSKWGSEQEAFKEEERLIAEIGIKNLTNMAYGGAGAKGVEFSKERKDIHRKNLETYGLKIHDLSLIAKNKNKKRIFTECGRSFLGASAVKEWMNKELGIDCNSTNLISHAAAKGGRCCGIKLRYKDVKFMEEKQLGHRARAVGNSDGMIFPSILKAAEYMRSIGEICSSPSIHGAINGKSVYAAGRRWGYVVDGKIQIKDFERKTKYKKIERSDGVIFNSLQEAAAKTKNTANAHKNISLCARGKSKTAYGYTWRYLDDSAT